MGKKYYYMVQVPIAGHAYVEVQAENEKEACEKALNSDIRLQDIEEWEAIEKFHQGNFSYCPQPWEITAERDSEVEDGDEEEE